jgi:hypothetical protein
MVAVPRSPGRVFAAIGVLFAAAYTAAFLAAPSRARPINGDAIQYYAYLRSAVFDRDLNFTNEYQRLYGAADSDSVWLRARTATGYAPNMMSIGPAILWSPAYLTTSVMVRLAAALGADVPVDGYSPPFVLTVGVAGIAYAALGAYLCFRAAALLFPLGAAFWGALTAWLASPALYYSLVSPTYSHAVSLFAVALFVFVWLRAIGRFDYTRFLSLGLAAGIAALVRWQDVVVIALPAIELADGVRTSRVGAGRAAVAGLLLGLTTAAAMTPQFAAWHAIYGAYVTIPQGGGFMRWTSPAVLSVLVSTRHGLWMWTPALVPASLGLVVIWRLHRLVGTGFIVVFLLSLYVNASVSDWFAGEAFGARRFVGDTAIFAAGLAGVFEWMGPRARRWVPAIAMGAIVYNLLFLLQYQLFMRGYRDLVPYPATARQILLDRLALPFTLLRAWLG